MLNDVLHEVSPPSPSVVPRQIIEVDIVGGGGSTSPLPIRVQRWTLSQLHVLFGIYWQQFRTWVKLYIVLFLFVHDRIFRAQRAYWLQIRKPLNRSQIRATNNRTAIGGAAEMDNIIMLQWTTPKWLSTAVPKYDLQICIKSWKGLGPYLMFDIE